MIGNIGIKELLIVSLVILLLFGAKRLPELAKAIGESILTFKKGLKEEDGEIKKIEKEVKT